MSLPSTAVVEVGETTVTFKLDTMGAVRVVHLNQASHPASLELSVHGHSRSLGKRHADAGRPHAVLARRWPDGLLHLIA
jgi:hypothetical protein